MTLTEGPTDWEVDPWDSPATSGSVERLRRETRAVKWAVWTVMVVVVVLVLVAGRIGWWYVKQINPEGTPGVPVSFTVNEGDTLESVSERLEAEGIIVNAGVFRWYVEEKGGLELTPGYYQLRPADHIGNIVGTLRTPPAETYTKVTFPEGFTIDQMATRLAESTERMTGSEFVTAANDPAVVSALRPAGVTTLEGLLFPDTYQVSNGENEAQVVERMVSLMERVGRPRGPRGGRRRPRLHAVPDPDHRLDDRARGQVARGPVEDRHASSTTASDRSRRIRNCRSTPRCSTTRIRH